MALQDFVSGFTRTYQNAADRGIQNMQFNERQDLRERAQAAKERVQQKRIAQLGLEIEQARKRFPKEMGLLDARTDVQEANAAGQGLKNDAQRETNKVLPERLAAEVDRLNQQIETLKDQGFAARQQGRAAGTRADLGQYRLGRAQEVQERQEAARRQVDQMRQTLSGQPQELPDPKAADPFSLEDVPEAIHNSVVAPVAAGLDQLVGLGTYKENLERDRINLSGRSLSDEAMNTGRQAIRAEMGVFGALEQQFTNASPEARSPQVAVNALRRIGRVKGKLKENAYGFDAEERKQMLQRIQRQEQLFSRYVPREDPIQGQAQQAVQGALSNEEYPSAVKALDVLERMREPAQADGTGTSPQDYLQ